MRSPFGLPRFNIEPDTGDRFKARLGLEGVHLLRWMKRLAGRSVQPILLIHTTCEVMFHEQR